MCPPLAGWAFWPGAAGSVSGTPGVLAEPCWLGHGVWHSEGACAVPSPRWQAGPSDPWGFLSAWLPLWCNSCRLAHWNRWDFAPSGVGLASKCRCRIGLCLFSASAPHKMEVTALLLSLLRNGCRGACPEHCRRGDRLFQRVLCKQLIVADSVAPWLCNEKNDLVYRHQIR